MSTPTPPPPGYPQQPYGAQPVQQPYYPPPGHQQPYYPPHPQYAQQPRQGLDGAQYVRQQTPHSLMKHLFFGIFIAWINVIYYSMSPNHYWKF